MITTTKDLIDLVDRARTVDAVALDTEFVWERTYYPRLGLIQIALSDEDCVLIDPTAIEDLSPMGELLSDRRVVKILHDAPQDLAILYQATGTPAQNVFDTKLAAGFANLPSTLSLGNLIKELLEIELPKTETRTNWLQRPLKQQQVDYALDDVRYLRAARVILLSRIIGPKIKSWLQEELNLLNNPKNYHENGAAGRYRKVRGAGGLNRQSLAILKNLYNWREEEAKNSNKPKGHIVKDAQLLALARKPGTKIDALQESCEFSPKAVQRYGDAVISIVSDTLLEDSNSYPEQRKTAKLTKKEKAVFDDLTNLIELKCDLLGIDPILVGNNSELKELVRVLLGTTRNDVRQLRQTEGWRKSLLEDFFANRRRLK